MSDRPEPPAPGARRRRSRRRATPLTTSRATSRVTPLATALALIATLVAIVLSPATPVTADSSGAVPGTPRGAMSAIAVGDGHACAIVEGGDVYCWGRNDQGQLGQGSTSDIGTGSGQVAALSAVPLGAPAIAVGAGDRFSCALLQGGDVKCWGYNLSGRLGLGDGVTAVRNTGGSPGEVAALGPIDLGTNVRATAIAVGSAHVCAIVEGGATASVASNLKCWGSGTAGVLGYGDTQNRGLAIDSMGDDLPLVDLGAGRSATAVSAGFAHTCAVLDDGSVKCWGFGASGQLGTDGIAEVGSRPGEMGDALRPIDLGRRAFSISAGGNHTCAILEDGSAKCWGRNRNGQLGIDSTRNQGNSPSSSMADLGPIQLFATPWQTVAGGSHTCAQFTDGRTACWGSGADGRLGSGSTANIGANQGSMAGLGPISLGGTAVAIDAGGDSTCAVLTNGDVKCFGANDRGQLGIGSTTAVGTSSGQMGASLQRVPLPGPVRATSTGTPPAFTQPSGGLIPLEPGRIVDTRPGGQTVDGRFAGIGLRQARGVLEVDVLGRAGIPNDTGAIVLNVTVNEPQGAGFVTVFPCGTAPPNASNLNHVAGQTIANSVIVKLGTQGRVCFYTDQAAHLIVDVNGAYPLDATFNALDPARLLDTRPGGATIDGRFAGQGQLAGGQVLTLDVVGRGGVPAGTEAVVLNVTVNEPQGPGFVTVFPCGGSPPNASNLNFAAGQTIPNNVIVKVDGQGRVCLFASATTHLIVDVNGSFPDDATFDPLSPGRLLDTRPGGATVDGAAAGGGQLTAGRVQTLQVTGRGGVPGQVGAVVLNVTVVDPQAPGFVTVFPCGGNPPNASNINFVAGQTIPNNVIVKADDRGRVCIFSSATTHLLADVNGSFPPL